MQVDVSILLPEKERMEDVEQGKRGETFGKNKKYQTLYLLHGFTGDHLTYLRTSKIERYADEHQIMGMQVAEHKGIRWKLMCSHRRSC